MNRRQKYSSYLTMEEEKKVDSLCEELNCSKAKLFPFLLENHNKNIQENEDETMNEKDDRMLITIKIDSNLHKAFVKQTEENNTTMIEVIRDMIIHYINQGKVIVPVSHSEPQRIVIDINLNVTSPKQYR